MRKRCLHSIGCIAIVLISFACGNAGEIAPGLSYGDQFTLVGSKHFLKDYQPINGDGTINVVIEIPTGTTAKWEVDKTDGYLKWEFKKGKPREVKFLGYPGNYGMVPKTLLPKSMGGDGDPLDVLVISESVPRGSVVQAKLIGILKMLDDGDQDDKLIAVPANTPFFEINSIKELDERFEGISKIIEIWFSRYKGKGKMVSNGYDGPEEAENVLKAAIDAYPE